MAMSPVVYGVVMVGFVVTAAVAGVAGSMAQLAQLALLAELQYRHADVWTGLGRPSFATHDALGTRWERRRRIFRFIYWGGFRALNDPRVAQLCNRMRFCALAMLAAFLVAVTTQSIAAR